MTLPETISGLDEAGLARRLSEWGEPAYRAGQILDWIHRRRVLDPAEMSDLPADLRERLAEELPPVASRVVRWQESPDGTQKALIGLADRQVVEAVLIPAEDRTTLCVSTQVGCAVGCTFCASGLEGVVRNLSPGEIVEQFLHASCRLGETRLSNVVVMGMGEPLHNLESLLVALRILGAPWGGALGARRVTISTSGVLRGIARLTDDPTPWGLALSLHAPDDDLRRELLPHRGLGTVAEMIEAGRRYRERKGRRVTIEYVLLAGVNDSPAQAAQLAHRVGGSGLHVNLIPFNPVEGLPYRSPGPDRAEGFARELRRAHVGVTLRMRRGDEIAAACGQLRLRHVNRESDG